MERQRSQVDLLQNECTVIAETPTSLTTQAVGPNGASVTVTAAVETSLGVTRICYTVVNSSAPGILVNGLAVPFCLGRPCAAIAPPIFSEPAQQPSGCCSTSSDALSITDTAAGCVATITFDGPLLPTDCVTFCLTYNALLTVRDDLNWRVELSSGQSLACRTLTVDCPQLPPKGVGSLGQPLPRT